MKNNNVQHRIFVFLERLWLSSAILSVCCMAYFLIKKVKDNDSAVFFFGFFILSSLLYLMRKRQRARFEAQLKKKEEAEHKSNIQNN